MDKKLTYSELEEKLKQLTKSEQKNVKLSQELSATNQELVKTKQGLQKSEENYKDIINNSSDTIYIQDKNGVLIDVNQGVVEMYGYPKDFFIGKTPEFLSAPGKNNYSEIKTHLKKTLTGTPQQFDFWGIRKNGEIFPKIVRSQMGVYMGKEAIISFSIDISKRKLAESELRNAKEIAEINEAKYRNRFEYFPFPSFIWHKKGDDFEMISANKAAIDASNENIENIYNIKSQILWKDEPDLTGYLVKCFDTQKTFTIEREYTFRGSGRTEYTSATYSFLPPDNVQIITVDITERRASEEELKNQKKLFETMFNTITDAIVITNTKREIILANEGVNNTFGYLTDDLVGKTTEILYATKENYSQAGSSVYDKEAISSDNTYITFYKKKNNEVFPSETFGAKLYDNSGNWIGNLGIMKDISEREKLFSDLKNAKEKAEESDRLKSEFINNMSHEIRTPMNGILGFSDFLNKPDLSETKRKQYTNIIQNSGNQLMRIIDDILEISKLGTKQVKTIEKKVCINDLLLEQFSIFDIKAKESKIPLYLKKGLSDEESTLFTDESKLNKIISNLLENALKFTNQGFIEIGYELNKNKIIIYVKDTGIGIKTKNQETIFERFSQEEKGLSRNVGGLGLGLAIAKENTELLGGEISLESTKGEGSTFFVAIPYKPAIKNADKKTAKIGKASKKHTILVAEDEEINYLYIETLLEDISAEINVLHAKNGEEAIQSIKKNLDIELILMDLKMPIINGFEATETIKRTHPNLPIIAQTAYSSSKDKQKAKDAGCDEFISKPIEANAFERLLNKYIKL